MKKRILLTAVTAIALVVIFCGFQLDTKSSIKSLTHPYINAYECKSARLGSENLLEKYDYFRITMLNPKELEVSFKRKGEKKIVYKCPYEYDDETGELTAEIGILGFRFKQKTIIKNGKFTVSLPILSKQLIMLFEVK